MGVIKLIMDTYMAQRQIGISTINTIKAVGPSFLSSAIMALALAPILLLTSWNNIVTVVVSVLVGAIVYLSA